MTGLELEIAQAQAEALGLAGKKLEESIDRFNSALESRITTAGLEELRREIASRAWALMVQREFVGFKRDNLRWLLDRFDIPVAVINELGRPAGE